MVVKFKVREIDRGVVREVYAIRSKDTFTQYTVSGDFEIKCPEYHEFFMYNALNKKWEWRNSEGFEPIVN